jgi:hypothetical protein
MELALIALVVLLVLAFAGLDMAGKARMLDQGPPGESQRERA